MLPNVRYAILKTVTTNKKAKAIVTIEKLRLVEAEVFSTLSKYGIKSVDDMDKKLSSGKLSEKEVGEDFFILDHLIEQKKKLEKDLSSLSINKASVWKSFQDLLELPRLNSPRL